MTNYKQTIKNFGKKMALRTAQAVPIALLAGGLVYQGMQLTANPNPSYVQSVRTYQDSNTNGLYDTSTLETFEYFKDGTIVSRNTEQKDLGGEVSAETMQETFGPSNSERGLVKIVYN
jgi:hypothetical protein